MEESKQTYINYSPSSIITKLSHHGSRCPDHLPLFVACNWKYQALIDSPYISADSQSQREARHELNSGEYWANGTHSLSVVWGLYWKRLIYSEIQHDWELLRTVESTRLFPCDTNTPIPDDMKTGARSSTLTWSQEKVVLGLGRAWPIDIHARWSDDVLRKPESHSFQS